MFSYVLKLTTVYIRFGKAFRIDNQPKIDMYRNNEAIQAYTDVCRTFERGKNLQFLFEDNQLALSVKLEELLSSDPHSEDLREKFDEQLKKVEVVLSEANDSSLRLKLAFETRYSLTSENIRLIDEALLICHNLRKDIPFSLDERRNFFLKLDLGTENEMKDLMNLYARRWLKKIEIHFFSFLEHLYNVEQTYLETIRDS